ncbi:MAG: hypothetical protein E7409_07285 [Ruminococcaceae bacterium]|nr:hypothetical protein [Oscillospiraceae bacterium]
MTKYSSLVKWRKKLLSPVEGIEWASEMVLNPALIRDPDTGRFHMLVRTTGPWKQAQLPGKPLPFPIFFGYGWSDDGENFEFDLSRPALSPALKFEKEEMYIKNGYGERVPNYANGCIEDPRLFFIDGVCYMTVATRMFPAGPYWDHDDPTQCMPEWARTEENTFGTIESPSMSILYRVDLKALDAKDYDNAFCYMCHLNDPAMGDDRDVFFFPKKMKIDGEDCYIMLQRPRDPSVYGFDSKLPSIVMAAAKEFRDFAAGKVLRRELLIKPSFDWQKERIGSSTPPIDLGNGEWLLNYHAKKNPAEGYGQSFMILEERENELPVIKHICNEKMIVNEEEWEAPAKFKMPVVFFTGLIEYDGDLLCGYGAADQYVGLMRIDYPALLELLRRCDNK